MPSLPQSSPAQPQGKLSRMQTKEKNNRPFCFQQQQHQPGFFGMALFFSRLAFFTLNWYRTYINWAICLWTVILFSSAVGRQDAPTTTSSKIPFQLDTSQLHQTIFLLLAEWGSRKPSSSHRSTKVRSVEGGGTEELSGGEITLHWK